MRAIHNKIEKKETAVREYKRLALAYPKNEHLYNRLMILFRQLKQPKNEFYWINKAIDNLQARSKKSNIPTDSRVVKLSKSISNALGLLDKKGNSIYQPGPVGK